MESISSTQELLTFDNARNCFHLGQTEFDSLPSDMMEACNLLIHFGALSINHDHIGISYHVLDTTSCTWLGTSLLSEPASLLTPTLNSFWHAGSRAAVLSKENDSWFTDAHWQEMTVRVPEVTVRIRTCLPAVADAEVMHKAAKLLLTTPVLCRWASTSGSRTHSASQRSCPTSWRQTHWHYCPQSLSVQVPGTRAEGRASSSEQHSK